MPSKSELFLDAELVAVRDETPEALLLSIEEPSGAFAASYTAPGQYAQIEFGDRRAYFAVATPPCVRPIEFLVKRAGALEPSLLRLVAGDRVGLTRAEGPGFPLAEAHGQDLCLVAAGTGIAALRPVALEVAAARDTWGRVVLVYGARHPQLFFFADELAGWERAGIEVLTTVSRPPDEGYDGCVGYVQELLRGLGLRDDTRVFVCGNARMIEEVRAVLASLGLAGDCVHTNY